MGKQPTKPGLENMEIAPGITVADWQRLNLADMQSADWPNAIDIFDAPIRRRFIEPVDVLIAHEIGQERGSFGFAILAIDCLLVETLQRFYEGRTQNGDNGRLIKTFLHERLREFLMMATATTARPTSSTRTAAALCTTAGKPMAISGCESTDR
jgi:hypothetical protein